jgi:hypothetical protein
MHCRCGGWMPICFASCGVRSAAMLGTSDVVIRATVTASAVLRRVGGATRATKDGSLIMVVHSFCGRQGFCITGHTISHALCGIAVSGAPYASNRNEGNQRGPRSVFHHPSTAMQNRLKVEVTVRGSSCPAQTGTARLGSALTRAQESRLRLVENLYRAAQGIRASERPLAIRWNLPHRAPGP